MINITYPVTCPIMNNEKIDMDMCFLIHMVVAEEAPKWNAPDEIYKKANYKEICNNCKFHRND